MEGTIAVDDFMHRLQDLTSITRDYDGFTGEVLSVIMDAARLPGESYSDQECLEIIHQLVNHWSEVIDL